MLFSYISTVLLFLFTSHVTSLQLDAIYHPDDFTGEFHANSKRETNHTSDLDLQNYETFFWGAPAGDDLIYANFTVFFRNSWENVIAMERFEGKLKSVNCGENMMLEFKDKKAFEYAKDVWNWVNTDTNHTFIMVTNYAPCADNVERQPFRVSNIKYDEAALKAFLTADQKEWEEVAHTWSLSVGHQPLTPAQKRLLKRDDPDFTMSLASSYDKNLFSTTVGNWKTSVDAVIRTAGKLNVDFDIDVDWFSLDAAQMKITPSGLAASIQLALTEEGELTKEYNWQKTVVSIPIEGIEIAKVVKLGAFLDVDVGFTMDAWKGEAHANFGGRVSISDSAIVVVDIVKSSNNRFSGWAPEFNAIPLTLDAKIEGSAEVYVEPNIKLEASALGKGVSAGLNLKMPYISADFAAMYDSTGVCESKKTLGVDVDANIGVELFAQAATKGNEANPFWKQTLYEHEWPLFDKCMAFGPENAHSGSKVDPNPAPKTKTKSKKPKTSKPAESTKKPESTKRPSASSTKKLTAISTLSKASKTANTAKETDKSSLATTDHPKSSTIASNKDNDSSKSSTKDDETSKSSTKAKTTDQPDSTKQPSGTAKPTESEQSGSTKKPSSTDKTDSSRAVSSTSSFSSSSGFKNTTHPTNKPTGDDTKNPPPKTSDDSNPPPQTSGGTSDNSSPTSSGKDGNPPPTTSGSDNRPPQSTGGSINTATITTPPKTSFVTITSSASSSSSAKDPDSCPITGCDTCGDDDDDDDEDDETQEHFQIEGRSLRHDIERRARQPYQYICKSFSTTVQVVDYPTYKSRISNPNKYSISQWYQAAASTSCINIDVTTTSNPPNPTDIGKTPFAAEHIYEGKWVVHFLHELEKSLSCDEIATVFFKTPRTATTKNKGESWAQAIMESLGSTQNQDLLVFLKQNINGAKFRVFAPNNQVIRAEKWRRSDETKKLKKMAVVGRALKYMHDDEITRLLGKTVGGIGDTLQELVHVANQPNNTALLKALGDYGSGEKLAKKHHTWVQDLIDDGNAKAASKLKAWASEVSTSITVKLSTTTPKANPTPTIQFLDKLQTTKWPAIPVKTP